MFFDSVKQWIQAGIPFHSYVLGDCNEAMDAMPDKFVNLGIVDPPYEVGADKIGVKKFGLINSVKQRNGTFLKVVTTDYPVKKWDVKPRREYFEQLRRISVNQIISGGNYFTEYLPFSPAWIIWDKCNVGTDQSDAELFWTSFKTTIRIFRFMWSGMMQGSPEDGTKQQGNKRLNEKRIHQAQKPVALYRWLLQNYAKPGDRLVSTHVGSASDLIAFETEGFTEYVGFEIDPDYYQDSVKRLETWRKSRTLDIFQPQELRKFETQSMAL